MQLGRAKLNSEERQCHIRERRCFCCGELGHQLATCSVKEQAHEVKSRALMSHLQSSDYPSCTLTQVIIVIHALTEEICALIDSVR